MGYLPSESCSPIPNSLTRSNFQSVPQLLDQYQDGQGEVEMCVEDTRGDMCESMNEFGT